MRCPLLTEKPGNSPICSGVASRIAWRLPKVLRSSRRFDSPTPGMRSSSEVIVRTVRRLRWKGPVYRISGLARQGTEALCRDVMKRLEELGIQEPEEASG